MAAPRPRKSVRPPANRNPLPGVLVALLLLLLGVAGGWWGNDLWQSITPLSVSSEPDCAPLAVTEPPELTMSAVPITGEGVIEFRFYRDGKSKASRTWIARLPIAAPIPISNATKRQKPSVVASPTVSAKDRIAQLIAKETKHKKEAEASRPKPVKTTSPPATKKSAARPSVRKASANSRKKSGVQYTIQVSSHKERAKAEQQVGNLERWGFDGRIERATLPSGSWYRVRVGQHLSRQRATSLRDRIRQRIGTKGSLIRE